MREKRLPPDLPKRQKILERRQFPEKKLSEVLALIERKCGPVSVEHFGLSSEHEDSDVVIFLPTPTREFKNMVYWGENHPINKYEQIYQGIGHILKDGKRRIIVISHFLYIYAAERTSVSAGILGDNVDSIMTRIEYEREIYAQNEKICNRRKDGTLYDPIVEIAGPSEPVFYGHTHPNIGTFFSPPDRTSGFATPNLPAVTFVADPIRKEMKAGVGTELREAQILVYSYENESQPSKAEKNAFSSKKVSGVRPVKTRGARYVKADELISEISRDCNELLSPLYGTKGKFTSHTTITGAQKIKMEMKWKPEKKAIEASDADESIVGRTYDSYA